jgi:hypothetical protein
MKRNSLTTFAYKYNSKATAAVLVYLIYFFSFCLLLFPYGIKIIWFGTPLIISPLYAWFSNSSIFRFKIKDENELTFSTDGIHHGSRDFFAKDIAAVVIYIYSFENFGSDLINSQQIQSVYIKANADKNIISFRSKGKVMDFTFYLKDYAQLCVLREVISDWRSQGINVLVKQKSNNDFVIQKTKNYSKQPASGFF